MIIRGLSKTTLLDYPGLVACTVFTGGCNMRCIFCQNVPLVLRASDCPVIDEEEFFGFLKKRKSVLAGVCISGGEPTLSEGLASFIRRIRDMGFKVKLDTNGLKPDVLASLMDEQLLDMVAMDIKSSPEDYPRITGCSKEQTELIKESAALIRKLPEYEFRTTVAAGMLGSENFEAIGQWLNGCRAYYLQAFADSGDCMTRGLREPEMSELEGYRSILLKYMDNVGIRGIA